MNTRSLGKYLKVVDIQCTDTDITGAALDSRLVRPGMLFFACKGESVDGNLFAQAALDAGAAVAVMDNKILYDAVKGNKVLVEDTIAGILHMGKQRLQDIKATKVAITGSFGKTSTKEMIRLLLSDKYKTQATEGNYNNMLGVSLTACGIHDDTEVAVFEMGTNSIGEIDKLSKLVEPNIAVLTGFGYAHIGKFGGLAQVVHEKLTIVNHMTGRGLVVAQENFAQGLKLKDRTIVKEVVTFGKKPESDIRLDKVVYKGREVHFTVYTKGNHYPCMIDYPYAHLAENFLAAFGVGEALGMAPEKMAELVKAYEVIPGRGSILEVNGLSIINDTYNASLDAVTKAIENLSHFDIEPKYALIGEVMEIDGHESRIYSEILEKAVEHPDIHFIFSGIAYAHYKGTNKVALTEDETKAVLDKIDRGVLLVKASHGCHFERFVKYMAARKAARTPQDKLSELEGSMGGRNAL